MILGTLKKSSFLSGALLSVTSGGRESFALSYFISFVIGFGLEVV
jgi:hypothetical protein